MVRVLITEIHSVLMPNLGFQQNHWACWSVLSSLEQKPMLKQGNRTNLLEFSTCLEDHGKPDALGRFFPLMSILFDLSLPTDQ